MPIDLITGRPGHGKTQFALHHVLHDERFKGRDVYAFGVTGLDVNEVKRRYGSNWHVFDDGKAWNDVVPDGAVIVMDEIWNVFPQVRQGQTKPEHYQPLSTHRHRGLDIVLVTQDVKDVDKWVRNRCERHYHLHAPMGANFANRYEWNGLIGDIDESGSPRNADRAIKEQFSFPKEIWDLYKSATIHTRQRRKVPAKVMWVPVLLGVLGYSIYSVYGTLSEGFGQATGDISQLKEMEQGSVVQGGSQTDAEKRAEKLRQDMIFDEVEYLASRRPVVEGHPDSAPRFKGVQSVVSVPRPAACVRSHEQYKCKCYSQQATIMDVSIERCIQIAKNGYYEPALEDTALNVGDSAPGGRGAPAGASPDGGSDPIITIVRSDGFWWDDGGRDQRMEEGKQSVENLRRHLNR